MGDAAAFNYIAMREAIADAQLPEDMVSDPRAGLPTVGVRLVRVMVVVQGLADLSIAMKNIAIYKAARHG